MFCWDLWYFLKDAYLNSFVTDRALIHKSFFKTSLRGSIFAILLLICWAAKPLWDCAVALFQISPILIALKQVCLAAGVMIKLLILVSKSTSSIHSVTLLHCLLLIVVDHRVWLLFHLAIDASSLSGWSAYSSKVEHINHEVRLYVVVKWWICSQRWSKVNFQNPRVEFLIKQDIVSKKFEACIPVAWALCCSLSLATCQKRRFNADQRFYDCIVYLWPHQSDVYS